MKTDQWITVDSTQTPLTNDVNCYDFTFVNAIICRRECYVWHLFDTKPDTYMLTLKLWVYENTISLRFICNNWLLKIASHIYVNATASFAET
jgi:hypothetical protein